MTEHPNSLAKLTRPHLGGILPRDRLYKRLDQGRERSIVWVAGPPGSGKTTLVADYLDTWAPECIWYQVDPGDADVATFFYYMAGALPEHASAEGQPALPLFTTEYQSNLPAFTRRYFRELFARLTPPFAWCSTTTRKCRRSRGCTKCCATASKSCRQAVASSLSVGATRPPRWRAFARTSAWKCSTRTT